MCIPADSGLRIGSEVDGVTVENTKQCLVGQRQEYVDEFYLVSTRSDVLHTRDSYFRLR
jgi:hypothetical protein